MKILNSYNVSFGQQLPTKIVLKSALKIQSYEEAKQLTQCLGLGSPGNVGFYKKAMIEAEKLMEQNKFLHDIVAELKSNYTGEELRQEVDNLVKKYGKNIEVLV